MNQILKNISISGAVLLLLSVAWVTAEIAKSNNLIEKAQDPYSSIERGIADAEEAFQNGHPYLKRLYIGGGNSDYPGVLKSDLTGKLKDNTLTFGLVCDTGTRVNSLDIEKYKYNTHYVLAYNLTLSKLLN